MTDEERKDLPPESAPGMGEGSRPLEDAPGSSERPEDRLGAELSDTADTVTRELRDLQDELAPSENVPSEPVPPTYVGPDAEAFTPSSETTMGGPQHGELPPLSTGAPAVPDYPAVDVTARSGATAVPEGSDDDRLLSMLAWLSMVILQFPVVSLIQLFSENTKHRPFQRHHAVTSLLFYAASFVYEILASIVFAILTTVTLGCGAICLWVIFFVPHVLALYYAFQAYGGKRVEVPYLSSFGRKQGWM